MHLRHCLGWSLFITLMLLGVSADNVHASQNSSAYQDVINELTVPTNNNEENSTPVPQNITNFQKAFQRPRRIHNRYNNQHLISMGTIHYQMKIVRNGTLYNRPARTKNSYVMTTTEKLGLLHHWVNVNGAADAERTPFTHVSGYYRFNYQGQNYWILGNDLVFNLKALRGHNRRLEKIITAGERMIGHSKYNERTRHYDCCSFITHLYNKIGVPTGSITYNQAVAGRGVSPKHMRRGDLIFFNTSYSMTACRQRISGYMAHVGMYLGDGLFLQDSPVTDNGGVDVSSLRDPMWNSRSKDPNVHKFNGIVRRLV